MYNRARIRLSLEIFLATEWTKTWGAKWNHNTATGESNRKAGRADVYTKAGGLMEPAKHTLFLFVAARYLTHSRGAPTRRARFCFYVCKNSKRFSALKKEKSDARVHMIRESPHDSWRREPSNGSGKGKSERPRSCDLWCVSYSYKKLGPTQHTICSHFCRLSFGEQREKTPRSLSDAAVAQGSTRLGTAAERPRRDAATRASRAAPPPPSFRMET